MHLFDTGSCRLLSRSVYTAVNRIAYDLLRLGKMADMVVKVALNLVVWIRQSVPYVLNTATTLSLVMVGARVGCWGVRFVLILFVGNLVNTLVETGLKAGKGGLYCWRFVNFRGNALADCAIVFSFITAFTLIDSRFVHIVGGWLVSRVVNFVSRGAAVWSDWSAGVFCGVVAKSDLVCGTGIVGLLIRPNSKALEINGIERQTYF
jgi:hypothetical protein